MKLLFRLVFYFTWAAFKSLEFTWSKKKKFNILTFCFLIQRNRYNINITCFNIICRRTVRYNLILRLCRRRFKYLLVMYVIIIFFLFRIYSTCFNISNIVRKQKCFAAIGFSGFRTISRDSITIHPVQSSLTEIASRSFRNIVCALDIFYFFTFSIQQRLVIILFLIKKKKIKIIKTSQ